MKDLMETTGSSHAATAVFTADGIPFVRCSCSTAISPQSAVWLREHTPNGGVEELRAVVAGQAKAAPRCASLAPMRNPPRCELPLGHKGQHRAWEVFWNGPGVPHPPNECDDPASCPKHEDAWWAGRQESR